MTPSTKMTKKHDIAALEELYTNADSCDQDIFAEMRSNLLLISGEHYTKKGSNFYKRLRDTKDLTDQQKLRLTKNHVQKITKTYANNIISLLPGVGIEPKNASEVQDQKAAELHSAIWKDGEDRNNLEEKRDEWCDDFLGCGEVATKCFWDPNAGPIKAFHQKVGEDGQPAVNPETGELEPDYERPVYTGQLVFEDIFAFNLLRSPEAKNMKESPYLIIRKMVNEKKLSQMVGEDEAKKKFIQESADETFVVFDAQRGGYRKAKGEVLVKEYYFRPGPEYPRGYFYIATKEGVLAEGELPGGHFPIAWQYFDKLPTLARGRGPVKTMRPYQAEINRAASKMAEHQITLGDDKLLIQNGTKISAGVALPGVRSINYTGMEPGILAGRDGSQYLAYMQSQILEMYTVMSVAEDGEQEKGQTDPFVLLFRAASQKKKFSRYVKRFERFLVEVCKLYLKLAKVHYPDDMVIQAVGRNERVNISEFKNTNDLCYEIKVKPQSEDIDSKMGKQIMLNHVLQYAAAQIDPKTIGKIIKAMPYANNDEALEDLTLDDTCAKNDILALDRGEMPQIHEYDDHVYTVKKMVARKRQADFKYLDPQIQANYDRAIAAHEEAKVIEQRKIQAAQAELIPTDGYMVTCDIYVSDSKDPAKAPKRARVPYRALDWLIKQLEAQGQSLEELENMNQGAVAQMAQMFTQNQSPPNGMGGMNAGAGMPAGAPNDPRNGNQQQPRNPTNPGPGIPGGWDKRGLV